MYRAIFFGSLFAATLGAPMDTCTAQGDCLKLTFDEKKATCGPSTCMWTVCLKFDYTLNTCNKKGDISHTCIKGGTNCDPGTFKAGKEVADWGVNDIQCQTVAPGTDVTFLLKDGSGCNAKGAGPLAVWNADRSDVSVTCAPRKSPGAALAWSDVESCTGNGAGEECIWKVTVPSTCAVYTGTPTTPPVTTTPPVGTQNVCQCQNGGTCLKDGDCQCPNGYGGYYCELLSCASIVPNYPDMKVLDSGFGPKCTVEEAAAGIKDDYDCKPEVAGCNVWKCEKPVPPQLMADIQQKCTNIV